jgi:hypothetical protein
LRYWILLLSACAVTTVFATLTLKRPILAAIAVSVLAGVGTGLYGARTSSLWMVGSIIVMVCSLPVTVVTGIVTENLMDKWGSGSTQ